MNIDQLHDLMLQSLEHEMGGVKVYETAVSCASNDDLREEWTKYLEQTRTHVQILQDVCKVFGIDPATATPSRAIVKGMGGALVDAMKKAAATGNPDAAQIVAAECVVIAETKDHLDWELMGRCAKKLTGEQGTALRAACKKIEDEEDEHLYHTQGWCRELWIKALGMRAVLPPPEEVKEVETAIGAARAEKARGKMLGGGAHRRSGGGRKVAKKRASAKPAARKPQARSRSGSRGSSRSK